MPYDPNSGGWSMGPLGGSSQPTMAPAAPSQLTPAQVAQIQATTGAMGQPTTPASPQQQTMLGGLFGQQNNFGQNLGSAGSALWGNTPAYGGGNILSGDAYGGSAAAPLAGLTSADYG
jgi:hypothetical protein